MTSNHVHSICLYRRSIGRTWWRVDAHVTDSGAVLIVSGDANEWTARIAPEHAEDLLRALRRSGDLVLSIGTTTGVEILHRLRDLFYRPPGAKAGAFEDIKAFLDANQVPWEGSFRASDVEEADIVSEPAETHADELLSALTELRDLLSRPGNDFTWSSWPDAGSADTELEMLLAGTAARNPDRATIRLIVTPAGPAQEVALASGWSTEFLEMADRIERALGKPDA